MLILNNDLISSYEKLVYSIISKYSNDSNRDDLFQAGMIGIIDASKKYNSNLGIKFTSFAYKYILGEVLKFLREDKNIRLSRDIINDYKKIKKLSESFYKSYGRPPRINEISKTLGIKIERIKEVLDYNEKEISIYKEVSDDEKLSLEDVLYRKDSIEKEELLNLKEALKKLNNEEKLLIYERYYQNKTQTEIAREKNISQVKVYRYEKKVLDKLRDKMT